MDNTTKNKRKRAAEAAKQEELRRQWPLCILRRALTNLETQWTGSHKDYDAQRVLMDAIQYLEAPHYEHLYGSHQTRLAMDEAGYEG